MTSHWCDLQNADVFLTIGSNSVENHPVSSKWVHKALDKGATWIVVDPRYTRTAEMADIYCPIRSGTDIAFYGGMFKYIFDHDLWQHEYVLNYTNASFLLKEEFAFDVDTGIFSGFDEATATYNSASWGYQVEEVRQRTADESAFSYTAGAGVPEFNLPSLKIPKRDMTLQDPLCVFQQMKKHYARYDLDTVANTCGMDKALLEKVYATYAATGAPDKSGTIMYALGLTQHTYGAQNCRALSMLQLLLGNIGVAGGGVNALRGEPNVQGATDIGMLVANQPGYLTWPKEATTPTLRAWLEGETAADGYYTNKPKFLISALKEWFGEAATAENDYGYDWWPKTPKSPDYSIIGSFELMNQGVIKGYFAWGMNPCHCGPNADNVAAGFGKLDWLVVADWVETETATFWKAPGIDPAAINTTVYYLPAALIFEKAGSLVNSGRWIQWRHQAVDPWDEAKPDYEIIDILWKAIVDVYRKEGGVAPEPILNTKWDYYVDGKIDPRPVAWALNGYNVAGTDFEKGQVDLLTTFGNLKADGTTACGMWIYTGFYSNKEAPLDADAQPMTSRKQEDPSGLGLYSKWSWSWPLNRRVIYNRASADMQGKPWNEQKKLVEWTGEKWEQVDVADFVTASQNNPVPPNDKAFFMVWEQNARLEASGMGDGPFPEHYEPFESPAENRLNGRQNSPCVRFAEFESVKRGTKEQYPIAITSYSVTEHWQSGSQTRMCPALNEAVPEQFIEMSVELAQEKGIENGEMVRVFNNRGSAKAMALVTPRFKPFMVNGEVVHQIGMTHHWGWAGDFSTGDIMNVLPPNVGDPNCWVPEYKAFLVDVEKA